MRVCCPVFSKKKETLALYITLPHWVYSHGCRGGCHPACHTHTQPTHRVNIGRPNPWNGRDQPDPSQWDEPDQPDPNPWDGCYLQAADPTQTHRPRPIPGLAEVVRRAGPRSMQRGVRTRPRRARVHHPGPSDDATQRPCIGRGRPRHMLRGSSCRLCRSPNDQHFP